jgi:hypothetical protein
MEGQHEIEAGEEKPMIVEPALLNARLRQVARELHPKRNFDHYEFRDEILILAVYLQRQLDGKIDRLPARYGDGVSPRRSVGSRLADAESLE